MPYTFTTVNDPQLPDLTYVTGINNNCQIVGYYGNPGCGIGHSTGFLDTGGNFTNLNHPGSDHTNPQAINDVGQIVGTYSSDQASGFGGFLLNGNTYTDIVDPSAAPSATAAMGINN